MTNSTEQKPVFQEIQEKVLIWLRSLFVDASASTTLLVGLTIYMAGAGVSKMGTVGLIITIILACILVWTIFRELHIEYGNLMKANYMHVAKEVLAQAPDNPKEKYAGGAKFEMYTANRGLNFTQWKIAFSNLSEQIFEWMKGNIKSWWAQEPLLTLMGGIFLLGIIALLWVNEGNVAEVVADSSFFIGWLLGMYRIVTIKYRSKKSEAEISEKDLLKAASKY